jgi:hypothetical protein
MPGLNGSHNDAYAQQLLVLQPERRPVFVLAKRCNNAEAQSDADFPTFTPF